MLTLPDIFSASLLFSVILVLIGLASFLISDAGRIRKIVYLVLGIALTASVFFILFVVTRRPVWWLLTTGLSFVLISGLLFSFYFETIELMLNARGFGQIGYKGWSMIIACVMGLIIFKTIITKWKTSDG